MIRSLSKRFALTLALAGLVLVLAPAVSNAQSFAFAIGSGGGCHHHRGGWSVGYGFGPYWGPGWGPGWYGPPPIVYAPPPVVQPIYIQPQTIAPVPTPSVSPYSSNPAPATNALVADSRASIAGSTPNDDRIVIRNAAGAQLPVSFLVDGQDVDLTDGATRTFVGKPHRTVQYDRGGRFGSTQQDLAGGQYEFRITATGWDLVRKPDINPPSRTAVPHNSLPDSGVLR